MTKTGATNADARRTARRPVNTVELSSCQGQTDLLCAAAKCSNQTDLHLTFIDPIRPAGLRQ